MMNSTRDITLSGQARLQVGNVYNDYQSDASNVHPLIVYDAMFDSHAEEFNARCLDDTRVDLLRDITEWADNPCGEPIYWLNGMAGTGKSTVSRTIAERFNERGILGASFFFKRGEADRGTATFFFTTLAAQLGLKVPQIAASFRAARDTDPNFRKALREQFDKLILQPFSEFYDAHTLLLVVDAFDECNGDDDIKRIIQLLSQMQSSHVRLKTFITSRPELPIRLGFTNIKGKYQNLILHEIPAPVIEHDICTFFKHELVKVRDSYNDVMPEDVRLPSDWPGQTVLSTLVHMAVPLFIFAATICRFIDDDQVLDPKSQLEKVLQYRETTPGSGLGQLGPTYLPVLNQLVRNAKSKNRTLNEFRDIVGPIVLLAEPLSISSLSAFLNHTQQFICAKLSRLHSVIDIPSKTNSPVKMFHLSFRDFLVNRDHTHDFSIDEIDYHTKIADRCLQIMNDSLRRKDICGLRAPGSRCADAASKISTYLPAHIRQSKRKHRNG
ncbi:hypothetical protein TruAng_011347 [Truncatella angustata]|nr:hypothetical protein TruAng_011347 [Truncatella angustata]